jgi:two-component system cell cycle response regulator DivK
MTTILLIEDDIVAARLVQKVLMKSGYTLHHASTGLEGLALAHDLQPDLVLVDLGLPDLDGKVVALQMSHFLSARSSMIVAFTAETGAKAKRLALAYGCQDFISKPIDTRAFPELIAQLIETVHQNRVQR